MIKLDEDDLIVSKNNVCAIVVCFKPNKQLLYSALNSLSDQVDFIYLFVNTEGESVYIDFYEYNNIEVHVCDENIGIASAQNKMINKAYEDGFVYVLLSDQDTLYPENYVSNLLDKMALVSGEILGVTPAWQSLNSSLNRNRKAGVTTLTSNNKIEKYYGDQPIPIIHAISSGMLLKLELLLKLGGMNETLFIDWVDNDMCWRAYLNNYVIIGVPSVFIEHKLGDEIVSILGRSFTKRSVLRDYYIIRNALYLALFEYRGVKFIFRYLIKKTIHHIVFSFLSSDNKIKSIRFILLAFFHGLSKRLGKL